MDKHKKKSSLYVLLPKYHGFSCQIPPKAEMKGVANLQTRQLKMSLNVK